VLSIPIIALALRTPEPEEDEAATSSDTNSEPIELVGEEEEPEEVEGVFVIGEDDTVTFRPVTVGIAGAEHFEVLEGLEEGETSATNKGVEIEDDASG
jgi:HlyD family secretion protein